MKIPGCSFIVVEQNWRVLSSVFVSASGFRVPLPLQKSKIKILAVYRDGSVQFVRSGYQVGEGGFPAFKSRYCM